jgi:hypothetical protein
MIYLLKIESQVFTTFVGKGVAGDSSAFLLDPRFFGAFEELPSSMT